MKKIVSVILSVLIIFSSVAFSVSAKDDAKGINFAVASDTHVSSFQEELEATNDHPIFWYANRRAAMDNESRYIFESFLNQCAEDDSVEFVLISGDLTESGKFLPEEHTLVASMLKEFEETSGKPVYVITGNHDAGLTTAFTPEQFKEVYADFGYNEALEVRSGSDCSYVADLSDDYRLIALDSCDHSVSTADGMTDDKIEWVCKQAEKAKKDGKYPILMMHHNLLEHMPAQTIISKNFIVKNHVSTAEKFADSGIKLVFTGHEHCSDATSYITSSGNKIYDFATTALSMYPITFRTFSMIGSEITYQANEVESIDTAALAAAVEGYTPEMLDAMNEDLNEFAKGYLKAGVEYRLARSLTAEQMGIDEEAFFADFVLNLVNKLTELLELPLYGEDSIEEIAAKYNIVLPESDYENGWDLATDLVAAHYDGNESYGIDSAEVTILLRVVALILREELSLLGTDKVGEINMYEYLFVAVASPLIYDFVLDHDGVDDNNGTIEGYGVSNTFGNLLEKLMGDMTDFINKFKVIANCIAKAFY